ncbi:alpha/beta-hydrolase [Mycena alexandri]|uniref:Alpha/beta-hydrolase n=1 Tax=Mycena alexandri TaxID=1745969 RepID=A0AAD6SY18_9AGAR|nr:alpha/beta-hydrolase [Mycena alexandri]
MDGAGNCNTTATNVPKLNPHFKGAAWRGYCFLHIIQLTVEPQGKNITINGVLTYFSLPKQKFDPAKAVLLLTDVFGLPSPDNLTYVPDYFNGDAISVGGNVTAWIVNHGEAQTNPPLLAVIKALKDRGVEQIAATGYCFGGLYVTRLVQNNTITVGTVAHPSLLNVPTDFELIKAQSRIPIEINNAELDTGFTPAFALQTDAVLGDGQYAPGYSRRQFDGVAHGFASDPVQVAAKQGAFDTSLSWIKAHLK